MRGRSFSTAVIVALLAVLPWPRAASGPAATSFDAIVVLGHYPPRDAHGVEYETRARVERGVMLFSERRAPLLLVTGGETSPGVVEADVMAEHAMAKGVPAASILRERASHDTIENARFSVSQLRSRLGPVRAPGILLVTSDYHLSRAARLFRCAGAQVQPVGVPLALPTGARMQRRLRELSVRMMYLFIDECARAGGP